MKHLLLFILISCSINLLAQKVDEELLNREEVSGYIVFANGDTLKGEIRVSTRIKNQIRVKFKSDKKKRFKVYKAKSKKVIAYGFKAQFIAHSVDRKSSWMYDIWTHFKLRAANQSPTKSASDMVFMECRVERENDKQLSSFNFYIKSKKKEYSDYIYYHFIEYKYLNKEYDDIQFEKITRDDFEDTVERFVEDYPIIRNVIGSQVDFSHFEKFVEKYNREAEKASEK